jgi:hypothetical protein
MMDELTDGPDTNALKPNFFDRFDAPSVTPPPQEPNFFNQFDKDDDAAQPGLGDRTSLNATDAYWRGTLQGSMSLAAMNKIAFPDDPNAKDSDEFPGSAVSSFDLTPGKTVTRADVRKKYNEVIANLARYDLTPGFGSTLEAAAALTGQIGGSIPSVESFIGLPVKGVTWLGRAARAGAQQAVINTAVDPVVQALSIDAKSQKEYETLRTLIAPIVGFGVGAGLHAGVEGAGKVSNYLKGLFKSLGDEDPQMKRKLDLEVEQLATELKEKQAKPEDVQVRFADYIEAASPEERQARIEALQKKSDDIESIGPLGPVLKGYENDWVRAKARLTELRDGEALNVLSHPEVPEPIAVVWGNEKMGLDHILREHPEVADDLPEHLARMTVERKGDNRIVLAVDDWTAAVRLDFDGEKKVWLLTAYQRNQRRGDRTGTPPSSVEPDRSPAPLAKENISTGKVERQSDELGLKGQQAQSVVDDLFRDDGVVQALAARRGGSTLKMERQRPDAGVTTGQTATGTALTTVPESPARKSAIRSLQQQAFDFADAINFPLRQGRNKRGTLGTFNQQTGVVRVKEVPDFEVVAHEAGHAIEAKAGRALTDLTNTFVSELRVLDYDQTKQRVNEGFAEWIRRYIGNPAHAEQVAPGFTVAFRNFMEKSHPDMLAAINKASESYRAYIDAPSVDVVHAVKRSKSDEAKGWRKVVETIREEGFPQTIRSVVQRAYSAIFDDKAPATRTVRELAELIKESSGKTVDLKAADNPDVLMRLWARSQQAAIRDMMDGVRPYHDVTPNGPSLSDALAVATGEPSAWGKWNPEKKSSFEDYLIARRAAVLWEKFERGDLPNPPVSFSKGDSAVAMAELERANPSFRQAGDMVHGYTRELLRKQFEGGLIDADLYQKLLSEPFYVPMMRDLSDRPATGKGGGLGEGETGIRRQKGSSRDIISPLESLMTQTFLVNRTLQHNDIVRSFVQLAKRAGIEGGKYVEPIPAKEMVKYTFDLPVAIERIAKERGMDPNDAKALSSILTNVFGEDPIVGSFFRAEPAGRRGEPIVFYREAGELKAARFMSGEEGHALYEMLTSLPPAMTDLWIKTIGTGSSVLRSGVVTNPVFALTNYIRDQFAAFLLRRDYVPMVSGISGIAGEFRQSEMARLYAYSGGMSGGASIAPIEAAVESDVNALAKKGYLVNRLSSLKGLLDLAAFTESGTRNSVFTKVYHAKKNQGLSDYEAMIEAAFQATDLIDFSRHGSHTMMLLRLVPFLNSYIQGLDKARRAMFEPMARRMMGNEVLTQDSQAFNDAMVMATKVFGLGSVFGAAWAALNWDKEGYQDAGPHLKGTHLVAPIGGKILTIPKPFELSIGITMGEYAFAALMKQDPRAAEQFIKAASEVLSPPNPLQDIPVLKTYFELKSGKSLFTGRDLVPDILQRRVASEQYTDRTSALAKFLGKQIDVSPIKIDHAIGSMFGLWGRDLMAFSQGMDENAPAQNWDDQVFFRRFIKDPTRSSETTKKFWDFMGQVTGKFNQNVATYDGFVKKFDDQGARNFLEKLPASERAFVILRSAANEDGKQAFKPDERRLHPLQRAYDAVTLLNGLRRELVDNAFKTFEKGENLKLDPVKRRDILDAIRELSQAEMRNSFVIMQEPGYANRALIETVPILQRINSISPDVAEEIAARYATAKIYPVSGVAAVYPELRDRIAKNWGEADVSDLVARAGESGFEFGGEKTKRPQKRRIQVPAR